MTEAETVCRPRSCRCYGRARCNEGWDDWPLESIFGPGIDIAHLLKDRLELLSVATCSTTLKVFVCHKSRHLLGHSGADKLIDGDTFAPRQLADPLVQGVRKPKTKRAHDAAPIW
jgi:hypothetical protein